MQRREIPSLDTTSTADISFILLIFFLVATSFNTYKGIDTNLPQDNEEAVDKTQVKARNVLELYVNADNTMGYAEKTLNAQQLQQQAEVFIENPNNIATFPERFTKNIHGIGKCTSTFEHKIIITVDRRANYDTYYQLQNAIRNAYAALREKAAVQYFGKHFDKLSPQEQLAVTRVYPMHIVERMETEQPDANQ